MTVIALAALAAWIAISTLRHGFWLARERDTLAGRPPPARWPSVVAVIPARDEAAVVGRAVASLAAQDYPGPFRIVLVDDSSSDGTAELARASGGDRLTVVGGAPLAAGWTGKLWAVRQGIAAAGEPDLLWLSDADIVHAPDTLRTLVARAEERGLTLVSLMAKLRCRSFAERALVPAFVYFFQMLYPFGRVNGAAGPGAAAGGCMLVRRDALTRAGGIAAIRRALIDDCAFGAMMKREGPIWLGLTERSVSIRPYPRFADVGAMIARSAYAQLDYSPWRLAGAVAGLALVYLAPPFVALFGSGLARWAGLLTWAIMAATFQPMLRFYRRSPLWGPALPAIAAFYTGCTVVSAAAHARGRGGMWKGRAQASVAP